MGESFNGVMHSERSGRMSDSEELAATYDVVVVGGGPAGLSGAMALGRARRSVLVIDSGEPRNAPAGHIHNYLGREGMAPGDLLAIGRTEVAQYGVRVIDATVTVARQLAADLSSEGAETGRNRFELDLADGRTVRARRLLVATGLTDELPDVPGLAERWGRDVLHCPYCHGWEVRDQAIGILGTGPFAGHGALLFRQWSADVTLFLHTAPPLSGEETEQLAARGITVVEGEVAAIESRDDRLSGVRLRSGEVVPRQAIVVAPRFVARSDILTGLGLEATDMEMGGHVIGSYFPAESTGATSVPGVYLAGNVTNVVAQVITSAAAGLWTGAQINASLIAEDTERAVVTHRTRNQSATDPFSAEMEAEVTDLVLGSRRHGI